MRGRPIGAGTEIIICEVRKAGVIFGANKRTDSHAVLPSALRGAGQFAPWDNDMNTSLPVLIVDDSRTMTLMISGMVRKLGFTDVDVAHDGSSALDQLRGKQYGLVLSDWEMQPMNGEELLKAMRQDNKIGNVPIILITAKAGRGASWLAGANAYLPKPFSESDLQIAIKNVLASRS